MDIALGRALRAARDAAKLSRQAIANKLPPSPRLGKPRSETTVERWENGEGEVDDAALAVYAKLTRRSEPDIWADALKLYPAIIKQRAAAQRAANRAVRDAEKTARDTKPPPPESD